MDTHSFDILIIGAGIAGASSAAFASQTHRVALIEAEEVAGYHSTGRSAGVWILNYGPPDVQVLTGLSRPFFETPPPGFTEVPLMSQRPVVSLAPPAQLAHLDEKLAEGQGLEEISIAELRRWVPALNPDYASRACIERDAFDMDVASLHQGFLRQLKSQGGTLALRSRTGRIERHSGLWQIEVTGGALYHAPILINAAGSWADEVAIQAGRRPIGLQPKRRTGVIVDPAPFTPTDWPLLGDVDHSWYCRPEARTRLMLSPADETDMDPQDIQPDELDVAIAIDRVQQALTLDIRRVEHRWAGLRSFTPDRSLAIGLDQDRDGFFWCAGQGGYGIQTSPAAGRLMADLVCGRDPGDAAKILAQIDPRRFA